MGRMQLTRFVPSGARRRGPLAHRSVRRVGVLATICLGVALTGCSVHVSKNGISGNILGHSFSGARGTLPAGFPSSIPTPDGSRVLGGGGADNNWDVAFAVTGTVDTGTPAYESKLRSAGFAISNYQSGTTPVTGPAATGSTSSTITATGATFEATDAQWRIQVASGNTSSANGSGLRAGEFALNITVLPASPTTSPTS